MIHVALVTDRAGSFATLLTRPAPRLIDGGRILVTTLATFDHEDEAMAFVQALRGVEVQARERMPRDIEALERHGLAPVCHLRAHPETHEGPALGEQPARVFPKSGRPDPGPAQSARRGPRRS